MYVLKLSVGCECFWTLQAEGLQQQYCTSVTNSATAARQLAALAFVSPDQVVLAFEELEPTFPYALQPIVDWLQFDSPTAHWSYDTLVLRPVSRVSRFHTAGPKRPGSRCR